MKKYLKILFFTVFALNQYANAACTGCCSSHGGIANYCSTSGKIYCVDGTVSPTCTCSSCGVASSPSIPTGQYIYFGSAPTISVGQTGTITATASSGLPVTLTSKTPNICTLSGNLVTGINTGTCEILANQSGSSSFLPSAFGYMAATQVSQTFTVLPAASGVTSTSPGKYDGIYLWDNDRYLSFHQKGTTVIASIYWVYTSTTTTLDTFDLMNGTITNNIARISGVRYFRACNTTYDLIFNDDSTVSVIPIEVKNNSTNALNVTITSDFCSYMYRATPIGSTFTISKIF